MVVDVVAVVVGAEVIISQKGRTGYHRRANS